MGVKRAQKWKGRHTELEEREFNAHSIGVVKGGHHRVHNDPYSGGQQSNKRAKSDAISPEANACAHAITQSASIPTSIPASFPSTMHVAPPHFMQPPLTQPPFAQPPPFIQPRPTFPPPAFLFTFTQPLPIT
jgi:hypothetical protein